MQTETSAGQPGMAVAVEPDVDEVDVVYVVGALIGADI